MSPTLIYLCLKSERISNLNADGTHLTSPGWLAALGCVRGSYMKNAIFSGTHSISPPEKTGPWWVQTTHGGCSFSPVCLPYLLAVPGRARQFFVRVTVDVHILPADIAITSPADATL